MIKQPVSSAVIARAFEQNSLLSDFLKPFPNLLGNQRAAIGTSFKRIAQALSKSKRTASIQFTIKTGKKAQRWYVLVTSKGADVGEGAIESPNLEIITDAECWTQIAGGELSPLEAFGHGRIRVRGSVELARSMARALQR